MTGICKRRDIEPDEFINELKKSQKFMITAKNEYEKDKITYNKLVLQLEEDLQYCNLWVEIEFMEQQIENVQQHLKKLNDLDKLWNEEKDFLIKTGHVREDYFETSITGMMYYVGWCDGYLGKEVRKNMFLDRSKILLNDKYYDGFHIGQECCNDFY